MSDKTYKGIVTARIVELRFATSGKLSNISKHKGDFVKKGETIALLDKNLFQIELDKQLADYEKKRAEFEIYNLEKGEPQNDIAKYLKKEIQAELDVSVKEVEIAKIKLDQSNLASPVEGIVIDDSDLVSGIYITPASSPVKVLDTSSYYFEIEIEQSDLQEFINSRQMTINIPGLEKSYTGNSKPVIFSQGSKIIVEIETEDKTGLILGLQIEAN